MHCSKLQYHVFYCDIIYWWMCTVVLCAYELCCVFNKIYHFNQQLSLFSVVQ